MQLTVSDLEARITRLDHLTRGLAREVALQKGAEDELLFREKKQHLAGISDALACAEQARVVLEGDVRRLSRPPD